MGLIDEALERKREQETLIIDNSSLNTFQLCPRKYLFSCICHLRPQQEKPALTFGSAFHSALEAYYTGEPYEVCQEKFVLGCLKETSKIALYKSQAADGNLKEEYTVEFGLKLLKLYIENHPLDSETIAVFRRADNKPYLEIGFALEIENGIIVGKIDGVVFFKANPEDLFIFEHKTTTRYLNDRYWGEYNPNNQLTQYLWAAHAIMGIMPKGAIVNGIRLKEYKRGDPDSTVNKLFGRLVTERTPEHLEARLEQVNHTCNIIQYCIENGFNAFWQNAPNACSFWMQDCEYKPLCMAKSENLVNILAENAYIRHVWHPYEEVEDTKVLYDIKKDGEVVETNLDELKKEIGDVKEND